MEATAQPALARPPLFVPQDITILVWSFATLIIQHDPLFEAIAAEARPRISEYETQDLCNTSWACSALGFRFTPLLAAMRAETYAEAVGFT